MLKLGKLKDPRHDAAAADVLAAFDAAQGGGLPTVECYHAAVGAPGVARIPIIRPPTRLSRRSGSFSTSKQVCGLRKCEGAS